MRKFIVSYSYIDKSFRERFGTIPLNFTETKFSTDNIMYINDFIYSEVENHLLSLKIGINDPNVDIRPCFKISYIFEF